MSSKSSQGKTQSTKEKNMEKVKEKAIKVICMGKLFNDGTSLYDINVWRHIGETEILGDNINKEKLDIRNSQSALPKVDTNDEVHGWKRWVKIKRLTLLGLLLLKLGKKLEDLRAQRVDIQELDSEFDISCEQIEAWPTRTTSWPKSVDMLNNISSARLENDMEEDKETVGEEENSQGPLEINSIVATHCIIRCLPISGHSYVVL
ncbi:hypothetical protein V6N13_074517 [Hibiscus sabdariffa]